MGWFRSSMVGQKCSNIARGTTDNMQFFQRENHKKNHSESVWWGKVWFPWTCNIEDWKWQQRELYYKQPKRISRKEPRGYIPPLPIPIPMAPLPVIFTAGDLGDECSSLQVTEPLHMWVTTATNDDLCLFDLYLDVSDSQGILSFVTIIYLIYIFLGTTTSLQCRLDQQKPIEQTFHGEQRASVPLLCA